MPAEFDSCVKKGGKVRTKTMKGGKYMHICLLDGKSYAGEVKTKQSNKSTGKGAFMRAASGKDMISKEMA